MLGLKPYASARSEYSGGGILLDANENALGSVAGHGYNRYPDPLQKELKSRIIAWLEPSLTVNQLFLGNGSDEAIDLLIRAFCEPGRDEILICPPTFGMFEKSAQINNVRVRKVPLNDRFQLDLPAIRKSLWEHLKIIFICSPNNPTGNLINSEDIKMLLDAFPGLVVVDEAYMDFAQSPSWAQNLNRYDNLVVMRTFSKAWGMAAVRLGLIAAHAEVAGVLNTIKMPYNVNALTAALVTEALDRRHDMEQYVGKLNESRAELARKLGWMEVVEHVYPSEANFLLVRFRDAAGVMEFLRGRKIIVRDRTSEPGCAGCLRVTVGTASENQALLDALAEFQEANNLKQEP